MSFNLKKILKSLMFSTNEPLTIKDIQSVIARYHAENDSADKSQPRDENEISEVVADDEQGIIEDIIAQVPTLLTATQIREAMEEIAAELDEAREVFRLVQSASGFKLVISKEYSNWVRLLRNDPRPQRLSRAALETLAIVAYRQPVTRAEIEAIRGVSADSAISRLSEKDLIFISGRADLPGRPIQYSTTQNFLDFVGVNSLEELPSSDVLSPNQISEWIKRASAPAPKDEDVGLPSEDEDEQTSAAATDTADTTDTNGTDGTNAAAEPARDGSDTGANTANTNTEDNAPAPQPDQP